MDNIKPKEPLLAVMLAIILPGLGQIYARRVKRGILFFCVQYAAAITAILYAISLNSKTDIYLLALAVLLTGFGIFVIVDAYNCAKTYNIKNNLIRNITTKKRVFLIIGIIFFMAFNPSRIISPYLKTNGVEAFKIPSGAMKPTLLKGDRILVDKNIYKKSKPKRGDLIVFLYPKDTKRYFVKRIVGLPNEVVEIQNGKVIINGNIVQEPNVLKNYYSNAGDYAKEGQAVKIPENSYYVLGDNSAFSKDGRYFGFVADEYIIGKAYKIFFPFNRSGPIK